MNGVGTSLGRAIAALVAVVLVFSAAAEEVPPISDEAFQKLKSAIQAQKGNWNYAEMDDWQKDQPPEKRTGQARWEVPAAAWYFNFGPTGIRVAFDIEEPREAAVMYVFPDSPAHEKIFRGDRIIGVNGKKFSTDEPFPRDKSFAIKGPRLEVAKAVEESEGNPSLNGILTFTVRRGDKTFPVELQLEQIGYFSPTFPYNCKKSRKLAEWGGDWFISQARKSTWRGKEYTHMKWGPSRMGDWVDFPAQLALLSFGDRYKEYFEPNGSGGAMWSWISGIRLINAAEKQQIFSDKGLLDKLAEMSTSYAGKSGPSGAYSHKTWYKGAPFQLAFAAGLNALGQALAFKCGAKIEEEAYLRTRYLLTCKTNEKGNIGYGAANETPYSAEDARNHVGNTKPSVVRKDEFAKWRLVGGSACTTLMHFVDPRDSFSDAFVKRGVRNAMAARWSSRQGHACGSLTFVYNTLAASIAPLVGEEEMYRIYMDDMRWWLNMARCHDGGWYFEPKIDTECNKYDRVHMTAAAILMLNAPLRALYSNGKGHPDPYASAAGTATASATSSRPSLSRSTPRLSGSSRSAVSNRSSGSGKGLSIPKFMPTVPAAPAAKPKPARIARRLPADKHKTVDTLILASLTQLSGKNMLKPMPMAMRAVRDREKVILTSVEDNTLSFKKAGSTRTTNVRWEKLPTVDRGTLALYMAALRQESSDAQALAGVYLEHMGKVDAADKYYEKAGPASADKLQKLFGSE